MEEKIESPISLWLCRGSTLNAELKPHYQGLCMGYCGSLLADRCTKPIGFRDKHDKYATFPFTPLYVNILVYGYVGLL